VPQRLAGAGLAALAALGLAVIAQEHVFKNGIQSTFVEGFGLVALGVALAAVGLRRRGLEVSWAAWGFPAGFMALGPGLTWFPPPEWTLGFAVACAVCLAASAWARGAVELALGLAPRGAE
jgi:hypothetical protein